MGASTITTQIIMFIAILGIATGLLAGIKGFTDNAELAAKEKGDALNNQIGTSFDIEHIYFNNNTNITSVYVMNTGRTTIKPDEVDVYIDGIRSPRNNTNRTIIVISDTEITNTGLWDSKEKIRINVNRSLNKDVSHEVIVTTDYSGKDIETFSVNG